MIFFAAMLSVFIRNVPAVRLVAPTEPVVDTDFYLAGIGGYTEPHRKIILHGNGTPATFGTGYRVTSVTGTWSYPYRTRVLTATLDDALDDEDTVVPVTDAAEFSPGMGIVIDDEQMLVIAVTVSVPTLVMNQALPP